MPLSQLPVSRKLLLLALGFLVLFSLRLMYGYWAYPDGRTVENDHTYINTDSFQLERRNYASKKMAYKGSANSGQSITAVDQKYEKVGTLTNVTDNYSDDEERLYQLIKQEKLMIQLERQAGLASSRQLNIALGVIPDKFDQTIASLRTIGEVKHIQIDKKDKTNEYKKLEAKRVSLQKARDTLLELKQSNGNVGDMIDLTNRLLDIENEIQSLGVSLGEFDEQNEFCTVKLTLKEIDKPTIITLSIFHRVKTALIWSFKFYLGFWVIISFGLLSLWMFFAVLDKVTRMVKQQTNTSTH
jgi:hypothetical protein